MRTGSHQGESKVVPLLHRILICGLRDKEKPTSLDYKCTSCPRAFTTPIGLASQRYVVFDLN